MNYKAYVLVIIGLAWSTVPLLFKRKGYGLGIEPPRWMPQGLAIAILFLAIGLVNWGKN